MTYVRYSADVETIPPGEGDTIDGIIAAMSKGGEVTRRRYGRSVRTSHAKAFALLKGELVVEAGLPPELAQGLFAEARTYPVIVRMAHVPGELLDDRRVSTPRGLAVKVLGVEGAMIPGHEGRTQDFVLDTGKAFNAPDATFFLGAIVATEAAVPMPEGVKAAVSTASRAANAALTAVGLPSANLDFYGHPFLHPLGEDYFSQVAGRYGDYVAKIAVTPALPAMRALAGEALKPEDENGLRTAAVAFLREHGAEWEVKVQLCTDLDRMPVEDASKEWPEDESPYRTVARLVAPPQEAFGPERQDFVDENLLFCPAHSLEAHRPLGSISRARMRAYEELGNARRRANGRPTAEPASIEEVPAGERPAPLARPRPAAPARRPNAQAQALARGLGWFSLALGAVEIMAPGAIKRNTGAPGPHLLLQGYSLREMAAGVAILASDRPVSMVWARVAGDLLDVATLLPALRADNPARAGAAGAMAFVLGATVLDVVVAMMGDEDGA